jgi:beta-mannanase
MTKHTAYEVASGQVDQNIRLWAQWFKRYVEEGKDRMAFIAPMPEMNGNWTSYGLDAGNFKIAFQRIQNIFAEEGVPDDSVRWVFAPNGWSHPDHAFENYYPGDDLVDAVGFSAYNYGYCRYPGYNPVWKTLESVTAEYIGRMRVMAPTKPVFLTQVATSGRTSAGVDDEAKNQWFREGYAYLARTEGVRGAIYFNLDDDICDMAMYRTWSSNFSANYPGYRDAVQGPGFGYLSPADLKGSPLTP